MRHHGRLGRVELTADELPRTPAGRQEVLDAVRSAGYERAEIDDKPFRSGSLNMSFARRLDPPAP